MNDNKIFDIAKKYGVPRKYVSCPGCGQMYGHHNTKVCSYCEECSKCCSCKTKENHISAEEFIPTIEF